MRVVLDTNVIVSGLNFPGNERLVLDLARRGRFELYLSGFILDEVSAVLTRKFRWDEERAAAAVRVLRDAAEVDESPRPPEVIEGGHADNRILECAAEVLAEYVVTGDRRHLLPLGEHGGATIVNAPGFLSALRDGAR